MNTKIIDAQRETLFPSWDELWRHRELTILFVKRHLTSRYRQMALGSAWSVLEPLAQLLLLTLVFGFLLRVETNGYPYAIYVFAALIPWQLFSRTVLSVAGSLSDNMTLISKVYFPRIILPLAALIRELVDGAIQFIILLAVAALFGFSPSLKLILLAPLVMIVIGLMAAGIGLWVASLLVRFRDVRPALSIALQGGMYLSPVLYAASVVPSSLLFFYQLNPMYWTLEVFRWLLLDQPLVWSPAAPVAGAVAAALLTSGVVIFTINERQTVDVL